MRTYRYVGPKQLHELARADILRFEPSSADELRRWLRAHFAPNTLLLTYVVTRDARLRLSDRHAEHVACARGEPVLAAGELELSVTPDGVAVRSVTNQSTGYCPEPSCFPAVARALTSAGLQAPAEFTHAFVFRLCRACAAIVVIKDEDFTCACCDRELPRAWNFGDGGVETGER